MQAVLLVEDDPLMEMALRPEFEAAGVELDYVSDGYAAIDRLRSRSYDAIVMDLVLRSGLSGFGVLNYVEMDRPALMERIFLVSGMSEQTVGRAAPDLLPRFFRKPIDVNELVRTVLAFLAGKPTPPAKAEPVVLIVDDDAASAAGMQAIVEAAGWKTRVAHDGRAAIEIIAGSEPDAIVLDLVMPGLDGMTVIEFLRSRAPKLLRRTIIVSGLPAAFRERLVSLDVCANLEKPLRPGVLLDVLVRCVGGHSS
jgi:DNA-binding response OmpR family regulator